VRTHPASLAHHYVAYRAHVRAKVACLRREQGDATALEEAGELLRIAERHLGAARVVLLLVGGLPGTGKSTLARGLATEQGWTLLRSDEIRKDLAGVPRLAHEQADYGQGLYTSAVTDATYDALLQQAHQLLGEGRSVVLDASWSSAERRSAARALATERAAELIAIRCECPADLAAERITARAQRDDDASDATPAVGRSMSDTFDPWPEAETVNTSREPEDTAQAARDALDRVLTEGAQRTP
jgi:predicted kinase